MQRSTPIDTRIMQSLTQSFIGTKIARPFHSRKARASRVTHRIAIKTPTRAMYDPDQYDPDANAGRGSGYVAPAGATATMSRPTAGAAAGRPDKVVYGSDGVVYDPDQYDPDANVRSNGVIYTPTVDPFSAPRCACRRRRERHSRGGHRRAEPLGELHLRYLQDLPPGR